MLEAEIPTTKIIIDKKEPTFKELEQICIEVGKTLSKEALVQMLTRLDQELEAGRDKKRFQLKGMRARKILTILGELSLKRRYYFDGEEKE